MEISDWIVNNFIEIFGAIAGIVYVFLEIRQNIWLWPVGIVTSAVYIWVFFSSKFYADMSLQGYYLVISVLGWYWWGKGAGRRAQGAGEEINSSGHRAQGAGVSSAGLRVQGTGEEINSSGLRAQGTGKDPKDVTVEELRVTRLKFKTGLILSIVFILLFFVMWLILTRLTDSPVPVRDSFVTSLSVIATWMLARKIYEHWYLWIIVNFVSAVLFLTRGLYPTVILYVVYGVMSFVGLIEWKKSIRTDTEMHREAQRFTEKEIF